MQIRGDASARQEAPAPPAVRRGSGLWSSPPEPSGSLQRRNCQAQAIFIFSCSLLHDLKLFEGLCDDGGCVSPGFQCSGVLITPRTARSHSWSGGQLSKLAISSPPPCRSLGAVQQHALTGSQARGTGWTFPAFGFQLLQGQGGQGEPGSAGV